MVYVISRDIELLETVDEIAKEILIESIEINPNCDFFTLTLQLSISKPPMIIVDGDDLENSGNLIGKIKETLPEILIIYTTANADIKKCKEVYIEGVNYFSIKPISKEELKELIVTNLFHNNIN